MKSAGRETPPSPSKDLATVPGSTRHGSGSSRVVGNDQPTGTTIELTPPGTPPHASPVPSPPIPPRAGWRRALLVAFAVAPVIGGIGFWAARSGERAIAIESAAGASMHAPARSPGAPGACTESRACVAKSGGRPAICRKEDGACVALESEDCRVLASPGDVENDNTLWVGAMFPHQHLEAKSYGPRSANAVELARRDFAEATGGLPPARPGGPKRPIAVVLCDDQRDPLRAAEHLVNDVRVPAILGFARSKEVLDLASALFLPKRVLALASNTASMLRDIPRAAPGEPRLVWRVTTSADMTTPAITALLGSVIEPEVRAAPEVLRPGQPMRVAIVRINNPSGQSLTDLLLSTLRWNGRSVTENGGDFRQILAADTFTDDPAENERVAREVAAWR